MEENKLAISTSHAYLVIGDCNYSLDALCTDILCEYKNLVFNLETAKIT
jgi:hypothetical protein